MNQQAGVGAGQPLSLTHEVNLMPVVLELIESIPHLSDQQEINRKVANFRGKMQSCKDLVSKLPGLDTSHEEQTQELQRLQEELVRKRELLERFGSLEVLTTNTEKIKKEPN